MSKFLVKGYEINLVITKSAYDRKAVLFANTIIDELKSIGIPRDDVSINTNIIGNKNEPAVIEFWAGGRYLRFSYSLAKRFIDNLYIIKELMKLEVKDILSGNKSIEEFFHEFNEDINRKEISKELKLAKLQLGLEEDEKDVDKINLAYKKLARKHHPDIGGSLDEFKKINLAHKLIKKDLGF